MAGRMKQARSISKEFYAYRQQRRHAQRNKALDLMGRICVDCGVKEKLQFDHHDPATKQEHAKHMWDWSWLRILLVLWKFELRCCACHEVRTAKEGHNRLGHARRLEQQRIERIRLDNPDIPDWVYENDNEHAEDESNGNEKEAGRFE